MKQKLHHKKKRGSLYEPLILLYEMNLDVNIYYRLSLSFEIAVALPCIIIFKGIGVEVGHCRSAEVYCGEGFVLFIILI